jgi:hypothetical protein
MTRRDMIARLKTISRRAATEGLDAPVTSNRDAA